ncbi:DUF4232 domain-containing protein [Schaalia georgiae]|nr:DUF4232 domain-containing protein [Schaalia georgiae]
MVKKLRMMTAALACVALGACTPGGTAQSGATGGPSGTAQPPATGAPQSGAATASPSLPPPDVEGLPCTIEELEASLGEKTTSGGTTTLTISFWNSSGQECTISGFPRVSFMASRTNETVGSEAVRDGEDPGNIFKVLPRESAHATLTLDDPAAAGCSAAKADLVAVVLPGDTMAMTLSHADLNVCSDAASAVVGPLEPGA